MKATINRTIEINRINVVLNSCYLAIEHDLKVQRITFGEFQDFFFQVDYYTETGSLITISDIEDIPDWLTSLINSRPEVGSVLDAKYHGLFSQFLNENIQL